MVPQKTGEYMTFSIKMHYTHPVETGIGLNSLDLPHMQVATDVFRTEYPIIEEFMQRQQDIMWFAHEIKVEKDIHDVLTNFTSAEKHGVMTTLKLFTLYEMKAGTDYWTGRFMKMFPRHEFQSMAATFGMMELGVHKPFYNKINELLNATDDGFYTDYVYNPVLADRMQSIDNIINHESDLVSIAGFSMVEGVILYSNFAFLKHFQSQGKNKLVNVVRGINSSAIDEDLHSDAGAYCFKELARQSKLSKVTRDWIQTEIYDLADTIYDHECQIIKMIFEKGDIEGITEVDMRLFIQERINHCLVNLDLEVLWTKSQLGLDSKISSWFYKGMKGLNFNDFFTGKGREYQRGWSEDRFVW